MKHTVPNRTRGRLVLRDVDWRTYVRLLRAFAERPAIRLTYCRGILEIMGPRFDLDTDGDFVGRLVALLTEDLNLPIKSGGSTTLRDRRLQRGLEPDRCYWIANEALMRGKRVFNPRTDPPPDLAIEVDVTNSSLDRMGIYAALRVPEVWRLDGPVLTFHALAEQGKYLQIPDSRIFPKVQPTDLLRFLEMRQHMDENAVLREFRAWVRERIATNWQ